MSTFAADDFDTIAKRQAEIAAQEEGDRHEAERRARGWRSGDGHLLVGEQKTVDREKVESWYETVYATQSPAPAGRASAPLIARDVGGYRRRES